MVGTRKYFHLQTSLNLNRKMKNLKIFGISLILYWIFLFGGLQLIKNYKMRYRKNKIIGHWAKVNSDLIPHEITYKKRVILIILQWL